MTGGTAGLGKEAAKQLANLGAHILLVARDPAKGERIKQEIVDATADAKVTVLEADLSSLQAVRALAETVKTKHPETSVILNNAGLWDFERTLSKDGIERTWAVNYLAPFLLCNLLIDTLNAHQDARIVNTASALHQGTIRLTDPEWKEDWSGFKTYRQSKLAVILFSRLLSNKLAGTGITVNAFHPGVISTELGREGGFMTKLFFKLFGKSPAKGADTLVWLASSIEASAINGEYVANRAVKKITDQSYDMDLAEKTWALAEDYLQPAEV